MELLKNISGYLQRPLVRPWALAGPVLILMICLPMLYPLRQPDPTRWHDEQQMVAATVQAMVEQHSLAIDKSVFSNNPIAVSREGHVYSPYSPMLPALLAPFYWVLLKRGLDYGDNLIFVQYLLTLIGACIPVALCVGLVYRLSRMFELRRLFRCSLGIACVVCGGLISYGVVINRHAPAALCLLIALSASSHMAVSRHPQRHLLTAVIAGMFAALAATLDPPAAIPAIMLSLIFLAMRWSAAMRAGAVGLYILGALPVLVFNIMLIQAGPAQTMTWIPGVAPEMLGEIRPSAPAAPVTPQLYIDSDDEELDAAPSQLSVAWSRVAPWIGRLLESAIGEHGLLSHYPMLILGMLGAIWVLHRNWTPTTKAMAGVTLLSCLLIIVMFTFANYRRMAYGTPWFVCASPMLLMWSGAWLKHTHRAQSWILVSAVCAISATAGIVGMSDPMPRAGYSGYSFAQATVTMLKSSKPTEAGPRKQPSIVEGSTRPAER